MELAGSGMLWHNMNVTTFAVTPCPPSKGVLVASRDADFIPFPARTLVYRGLNFSRSSLFRLRDKGLLKLKRFRISGSTMGRVFILRESLDAWIERELASPENQAV